MEISAKVVKDLREKTGAGMMDCKKALQEVGGDIEKAIDYLRQKGILKASKKSGRATREGLIYSYIHPGSKIGVLIEVNCETDFAARTEKFGLLVRNLAMQVAATNPISVGREGIRPEVLEREKNIYRAQMLEDEKNKDKPEALIEKIIEGKVRKFYEEVCLLEQNYVREPERKVEDIIKSGISEIGENINVARFVRYQLGETSSGASETTEE